MNDIETKAIETVRGGGIIIFPTDTALGIGCRIDDTDAVDRLFAIRKRPRGQATPVLISSRAMALPYLDHPSDVVRRLMDTYWPGALTIVTLCLTDMVYSPVRGGGGAIGVRMPNHQTILRIIEGVGVPILGPSANFHGAPTVYAMSDLDEALISLVDYIVPGECTLKQVSTVVDCTTRPYHILRQGAVRLP